MGEGRLGLGFYFNSGFDLFDLTVEGFGFKCSGVRGEGCYRDCFFGG